MYTVNDIGERFVEVEFPIEVGETEIILHGRVVLLDHNVPNSGSSYSSPRKWYSNSPLYYAEGVDWGDDSSRDSPSHQLLCVELIIALDLQHKIDDIVYDIVMAAREYEADLQIGYAEEKGQY